MIALNMISIQKNNAVCIPLGNGLNTISKREIVTFNSEISLYGLVFDKNCLSALQNLDRDSFLKFKSELISYFDSIFLQDLTFKPLLKSFDSTFNFEQPLIDYFSSIMASHHNKNAYDLELLHCGHFVTKGNICPLCQSENTLKKEINSVYVDFKVLHLVSESCVLTTIQNMINAKLSYSLSDKLLLNDVFRSDCNLFLSFDYSNVNNKENIAYLSSKLYLLGEKGIDIISGLVKTTTDILRLAGSFSTGVVTLSEKVFFKLKNKERELILVLLNKMNTNALEDLLRYREEWLILAKYLHLGKKHKKYPVAFYLIDQIRNNSKNIKTFNRSLELLFKAPASEKNTNELVELLTLRPGVFARSLDFVLRRSDRRQQQFVIDSFINCSEKISSNVLLSIYKYFKSYNVLDYRPIFPNGSIQKIQIIKNDKIVISNCIIEKLTSKIKTVIVERFNKKEHFKNVYIDKCIQDAIVPFSTRSNTLSTRPIVRGSKIKFDLEKNNVVRLFTQWFNEEDGSRVDLDLSAFFLNDELNHVGTVSYYDNNFDNKFPFVRYSGDRTDSDSEFGSAEFIDVNLDVFNKTESPVRYICMCVNVYTRQSFSDFKSVVGVQFRNSFDNGELYDAKALVNSFSLNNSSNNSYPLIFDLKTNELIWMDICGNFHHGLNNVQSNEKTLNTIVQVFKDFNHTKLTMSELIELHKDRFEHIDTEFNENKKYDLIIDKDFLFNQANIIANWI